jgi:PII-like signaling protein
VIADGLKLSVYFGDSLTTGAALSSDALMQRLAERRVRVAALMRGVEGFGINRRIHAERFPDISTDLPLLAMAVDERSTIESLLEDVDAAVPRGLVTLERATLATGEDVAGATFPGGPGGAAKLTVYCGRGETVGGRPAHRAVVETLRRHGAAGAIVLLGVDGAVDGRRTKARLFAGNADTPVVIISVGSPRILERCLPHLRESLPDPVVTLENIAQLKHDGDLLEPPPTRHGDADPDVWHTLRVYSRQSALVDGRSLHSELTRRIREVGGAGVTTVLGEWGFSSDETPYGDRLGRLAGHAPTYTVYIDRPSKVAEVWPIVDDVTAEHGIVTWLVVPGYRERAGDRVHGDLRLRDRAEPQAPRPLANTAPAGPPAGARSTLPAVGTTDADWVRSLCEQVAAFAGARGRPEPLVRVTLADGEQFFLAAVEPTPGGGFVTLHPHPQRYDDMLSRADGPPMTPRVLIVPRASIAKIELLSRTPRGTRSLVGFRTTAS